MKKIPSFAGRRNDYLRFENYIIGAMGMGMGMDGMQTGNDMINYERKRRKKERKKEKERFTNHNKKMSCKNIQLSHNFTNNSQNESTDNSNQ